MLTYNYQGISIKIDLEPGIHVFRPISATGKTFLYKTLLGVVVQGHPVFPYSYVDYIRGTPIAANSELYVFDRMDRYPELQSTIEKLPGVVLMDWKHPTYPFYTRVSAHLSEREILVCEKQ